MTSGAQGCAGKSGGKGCSGKSGWAGCAICPPCCDTITVYFAPTTGPDAGTVEDYFCLNSETPCADGGTNLWTDDCGNLIQVNPDNPLLWQMIVTTEYGEIEYSAVKDCDYPPTDYTKWLLVGCPQFITFTVDGLTYKFTRSATDGTWSFVAVSSTGLAGTLSSDGTTWTLNLEAGEHVFTSMDVGCPSLTISDWTRTAGVQDITAIVGAESQSLVGMDCTCQTCCDVITIIDDEDNVYNLVRTCRVWDDGDGTTISKAPNAEEPQKWQLVFSDGTTYSAPNSPCPPTWDGTGENPWTQQIPVDTNMTSILCCMECAWECWCKTLPTTVNLSTPAATLTSAVPPAGSTVVFSAGSGNSTGTFPPFGLLIHCDGWSFSYAVTATYTDPIQIPPYVTPASGPMLLAVIVTDPDYYSIIFDFAYVDANGMAQEQQIVIAKRACVLGLLGVYTPIATTSGTFVVS